MKTFCVLAMTMLAIVNVGETYSTKNDNVDVMAVVANPNILKEYLECFIDKGACTDVTGDFKKDMSEAVQLACANCNGRQKTMLKIFLNGLKENMPSGYEDFKKKYDPDNKFMAPLEAVIAKA